jgi:prolyl oligopeptidase
VPYYPSVIVTTSTKDDRVHPYHARAFVKRLKNGFAKVKGKGIDRGDVIYYENIEGGHGVSLETRSRSHVIYNFFFLLFLVFFSFFFFLSGSCG